MLLPWPAGVAGLADHFELLGYVVVALFAASWTSTVLLRRFRYGKQERLAG